MPGGGKGGGGVNRLNVSERSTWTGVKSDSVHAVNTSLAAGGTGCFVTISTKFIFKIAFDSEIDH